MNDYKDELNDNTNYYLNDYEIEIKSKKSFLDFVFAKIRRNNKLLNPGNSKLNETTISIKSMLLIGNIKANVYKKLDYISSKFYRHKKIANQYNIDTQIIERGNIIKDISKASRKLSKIQSPIIPKIKTYND